MRTGSGAQQPPRLGCGHFCTAGCWRLTFDRDAYSSQTQIGCSCLGSLAALRTGCGAQQPPRLGCGHLCTAGCWRPTFHRAAYLSHTHIGCCCLGSLAALRTGCGAQQPPRLGCGHFCTAGCWRPTLHRDAYVSHTHWLQLLGLICCTEDRLWRTTTTPPRMGALLHPWLLAAYLSPGRAFVTHTLVAAAWAHLQH